MPQPLIDRWTADGAKQIIAQIGLLPVSVARRIWQQPISSRRLPVVLGNEAGREGLVKAYSPSKHSRALSREIAAEEVANPAYPLVRTRGDAFKRR